MSNIFPYKSPLLLDNPFMDTLLDLMDISTSKESREFSNLSYIDSNLGVRKKEEKDSVIYEFDVPGIPKKDISITINQGVLSVSASKDDKNFKYSFVLPKHLQNLTPEASLDLGVLYLTYKLPKETLPDGSKKIPIK